MINVAILGSYKSSDLFNINLNPNIKNDFSVEIDVNNTSLISLMQSPCIVDYDLLKIFPETEQNMGISLNLKDEFEKSFFNYLDNKNVDILIIDNFNEIDLGIGFYDGIILTNNDALNDTKFYRKLNSIELISIFNQFEYYFDLWKESCDQFFKLMHNNYPNIKIILNMVRSTGIVEKEDGSIYFNNHFSNIANDSNYLISQLDEYILSNYDVDILDFDFNQFHTIENSPYSEISRYYNKDYYENLAFQLLNIFNSYESYDARLDFLNKKNIEYINQINSLASSNDYFWLNLLNNSSFESSENSCLVNVDKINSLKSEISCLNMNNDLLKNELTILEKKYFNLNNDFKKVNKKLNKTSNLNKSLLSSNSWKITKPLRNLKRFFSK